MKDTTKAFAIGGLVGGLFTILAVATSKPRVQATPPIKLLYDRGWPPGTVPGEKR